ncbi:MAG: hypothetical protein KIT18_07115 [Burkholderiales bacterium]|nr:hypothetical protein [Burkholderiales bacterium]MCW5604297.1 hypothetical protein [Burkholderiales bacterium]
MKRPTPSAPPATLYAAALYLATRYAGSGCPAICRMVVEQFECIANHPDPEVPEVLRKTCRRLQAEWERIGAERELAVRKTAAPDTNAQRLH